MAGWGGQAADIGPTYDFGVQTQDGSTIACKTAEGGTVNLSGVAYVAAPGQDIKESTELQEKSTLTRLSSANVIDREFDKWPQATQGDWTHGEGQRVFVDPSSYYQGRGLLWPRNSVQPQQPFASIFSDIVTLAVNTNGQFATGEVTLGAGGGSTEGYAFVGGAPSNIISAAANNGSRTVDSSAAAQAQKGSIAIAAGGIFYVSGSGPTTLQVSAAGSSTGLGTLDATNPNISVVKAGYSGGNLYVAATLVSYGGSVGYPSGDKIIITQIGTSGGAFTNAGTTTINLPAGQQVTGMAFNGPDLIIACVEDVTGSVITLYDYNIPSGTMSVIDRLSGYSAAIIEVVSGVVVILASGRAVGVSVLTPTIIDLYVLTGSSLNFTYTLPPVLFGSGNVVPVYGQPFTMGWNITSHGPYAIFCAVYRPASVADLGNTGTYQIVVFAYDVTTGAVFTASKEPNESGMNVLPVVGTVAGTSAIAGTPINDQWSVFVYTNGGKYWRLGFGTYVGGFASPIPSTGRVVSSLVDFTSAAVKLFRQIVIDHEPIAVADGSALVRCSVWLDQSPDNLKTLPDFTTTNATAGSKQTVLPINKTAKKITYILDWFSSIVYSGAGNNPSPAPRPISVKTQIATGWVWDMTLSCAENAKTNNAGSTEEYVFAQQGIDSWAAYDFLRQLWRQKGGLCKLTGPNQDAFNAVIQSMDSTSPKPYTTSDVSNRKPGYEVYAHVLIREDI